MSVNNTTIHTQLPPNTAGQPAKVSNTAKKTLHRPFNPVASPSTIKDSPTIKIPLNSKSLPILSGVPSSQNVGFLTATNLYPNVKNSPAKNISRTGFAHLKTANTIEIVSKSQGGNTQTIYLSTAGKVRTQQVTAKIQSANKGSLVSIVSRTNNPTKTIQQGNIQNTAVVPDMKKYPNVTHQEKTTKTIIANPLNNDQNFSGKNFANPNPVVQAVVNNNYNISSNKNSTNIASPSARAVNQTNPVAFGGRKPTNNPATQMMKNISLTQYKVLMPGKPSQIVKPQTVVNLKTDNINNKTLPHSTYQQAGPTAPSTGRSGQAELRIIQNNLLPQATNTQQSPKTNFPNILRRQPPSRHVSNNDTSATNKPFGPRKEMSRPQIIQATGAKISNGAMIHNHNYPLTQSPFSTKNDQQNKMNNIIRIGSAASASLHNGNQYNNGYNLYTQGGNSPHMKNKPNNNTRVTNLHGLSVQRGPLQNKQPSSKMYAGNAPGTFNHVVVSQPGQRPVGTSTVVATSGLKRDFQTMQGDAQASSAIISRCTPSSKVIEKVQRSPRKKPRKQKHTVALDAGYSDEFVVVDSREEVKHTYRKKSGEKSTQPLSNFNPIAQAQVGAISISNKPNQQQTYRNIQPKSDLTNEKSSVVKQQQQVQTSNKMDSFDMQMKLITNQKQAVQPLQQESRPAPSKNTSGEAPIRSQRPTVGSNHRYSVTEEAVRPPLCCDKTYVYHRPKRRPDILNGHKIDQHINNHFNKHSEVKIKPAKKPSLTDKEYDKGSFKDFIRNIGTFAIHLNSMINDERSQQGDLQMISKELVKFSDQVMNQDAKMDPWEVLVSDCHLSKLGLSDRVDMSELDDIPLSVSANSISHKFGFVAKKPFVVPGAVATAIHTVPSVKFTCLNNHRPEVDTDKLTVQEKNRFKMRTNFQKVHESVQINSTKSRVSMEQLGAAFAKMQSTVQLRDFALKIVAEGRRVEGERAPLNGSNRQSSAGAKSGKKRKAHH